jgi:hypothetical protein
MPSLTQCTVRLVTPETLSDHLVEGHPLHPAYEYLSEVHKSDYLRTYFMHFHGGGYSDIKRPGGAWKPAFEDLRSGDAWMCGYPEISGGVAYPPLVAEWGSMVGNGSYIFKPRTPLTEAWYGEMLKLCDVKLELLRQSPATHARDCAELSAYPLQWNELLGRIFHRVSYAYRDKTLRTLPMPVCSGYA